MAKGKQHVLQVKSDLYQELKKVAEETGRSLGEITDALLRGRMAGLKATQGAYLEEPITLTETKGGPPIGKMMRARKNERGLYLSPDGQWILSPELGHWFQAVRDYERERDISKPL